MRGVEGRRGRVEGTRGPILADESATAEAPHLTSQIAAGELQGIDVDQVVVPTKDSEALRAYSIEYE